MDSPKPLDQASLLEPSIVPQSAERVWVAVPEGMSETGSVASLGAVSPTQVRRPWRATSRTLFAAFVALASMLPLLVDASGLDETLAPVAGALAIAGAVTRIMALSQVEVFLRTFVPFLSAAPKEKP